MSAVDHITSAINPTRRRRSHGRTRRMRRLLVLGFGLAIAFTLWRKIAVAQINPPVPLPFPYAYLPSPNYDDRPAGATVSCIVVHSTVEPTTEGTMGIFLNPASGVSAHFVVGKDGRVVQMVPVEKRAWHAGSSVLDGVPAVNDYSVGIEMVNLNDGKDPYAEAQIASVAGIVRFLRSRYNIPDGRIVSHAQIALPAGRKSDPVAFDFVRLCQIASEPGPPKPPAQPQPVTTDSAHPDSTLPR